MNVSKAVWSIIFHVRSVISWNGFADLLANLIEKYAAVLDIDNLPEVKPTGDGTGNVTVNDSDKNFTGSCIDSEEIA